MFRKKVFTWRNEKLTRSTRWCSQGGKVFSRGLSCDQNGPGTSLLYTSLYSLDVEMIKLVNQLQQTSRVGSCNEVQVRAMPEHLWWLVDPRIRLRYARYYKVINCCTSSDIHCQSERSEAGAKNVLKRSQIWVDMEILTSTPIQNRPRPHCDRPPRRCRQDRSTNRALWDLRSKSIPFPLAATWSHLWSSWRTWRAAPCPVNDNWDILRFLKKLTWASPGVL